MEYDCTVIQKDENEKQNDRTSCINNVDINTTDAKSSGKFLSNSVPQSTKQRKNILNANDNSTISPTEQHCAQQTTDKVYNGPSLEHEEHKGIYNNSSQTINSTGLELNETLNKSSTNNDVETPGYEDGVNHPNSETNLVTKQSTAFLHNDKYVDSLDDQDPKTLETQVIHNVYDDTVNFQNPKSERDENDYSSSHRKTSNSKLTKDGCDETFSITKQKEIKNNYKHNSSDKTASKHQVLDDTYDEPSVNSKLKDLEINDNKHYLSNQKAADVQVSNGDYYEDPLHNRNYESVGIDGNEHCSLNDGYDDPIDNQKSTRKTTNKNYDIPFNQTSSKYQVLNDGYDDPLHNQNLTRKMNNNNYNIPFDQASSQHQVLNDGHDEPIGKQTSAEKMSNRVQFHQLDEKISRIPLEHHL